jgi:WD40 repeat protein
MHGTRLVPAALAAAVLTVLAAEAGLRAADKASDSTPALHDLTGIQRLAYSADGKSLLILYNVPPNFNGTATAGVWDVETGKFKVKMEKVPDHCDQVAFSPDGTMAAGIAAGAKRLTVWDAGTGKAKQEFKLPDWQQFTPGAPFLGFSPDGANLNSLYKYQLLRAKLGGDAKVLPTDLQNWSLEFTAYAPATEQLMFAVNPPVGQKGPGKLRVYDLSKGGDPQTVPLNGWVRSIGASADGKTVVVAYEVELSGTNWVPGKVEIWDAQTWKVRSTLPADKRKDFWSYVRLFVSPDGKTIAGTPNVNGKQPNAVELLDADGKLLREIASPPALQDIAFSPDGKTATAVLDGKPIQSIDTTTGKDK